MQKETKQQLDGAISRLGPSAAREAGENYHRTGKVIEFIKKYTGGYQQKKLLDVGCSIGVHALAAKSAGADVTGLDKYTFPDTASDGIFTLPKEEFSFISEAWKEAGVTVIEHDIESRFPFETDTFDLVVSNAVIEHLHGSHHHFLTECARVLKPGGFFILTTPNLASLFRRIRFIFGKSSNGDLKSFFFAGKDFTGHTREFTVEECEKMLLWSGFTVQKACAIPTYIRKKWITQPKKYHWILSYFLSFLGSRFGDHVFILARKNPS